MDLERRTLDGPGRGYLVRRLRDRGYSLDMADRVVNLVFDEMSQALRRGEYVEFPFGYLKAEKGRRSGAPLTIEHIPDEQGWKLLEGEEPVPAAAGWSLAHDTDLRAPKLEPLRKPERIKRKRGRKPTNKSQSRSWIRF